MIVKRREINTISSQLIEEDYTFKELCNLYMEKKQSCKKSTTLQCDIYSLRKFDDINDYKIKDITPDIIQDILNEMNMNGLSTGYINKIRSIINKIFNFALEQELINSSPVLKVYKIKRPDELKKEMSYWTLSEFECFSEHVAAKDTKYYVLFNILYYMGCRKGEALALQWGDINFSKRTIRINKTIAQQLRGVSYKLTPPKTANSIRTIKIPSKLYDILLERYNNAKFYRDFNSTFFVVGGNYPMSLKYVGPKFKEYSIKANLPIIRIHDLRHSHASLLINQGANIKAIASRLGDNVDTVLSVYTHLFHETEDELVSIIDHAYDRL